MSERKVSPASPGGFRDYLPADMIPRAEMLRTIERVFERFGFDPLKTPGIERLSVLTGGDDETTKLIYQATLGRRDLLEPLALRFDLTVPLARVVAANADLPRPFKRYQVGDVWRGEKPQAGRFREFMQFDADIVGTTSVAADTEIVALMVATMQELVPDEPFRVHFNTRKLLNGLPAYAGFAEERAADVLRIIDKLPKVGIEAVLRELGKRPPDEECVEELEGADQRESAFGAGLSADAVTKIGAFLEATGTTDELLDQMSALFAGVAVAEEGIEQMRQIVTSLRAMQVNETNWVFDLSIARGLSYYTGPVFETFLGRLPKIGSVFSGGRYDGLVSRFIEGNIAAVGASVGVDRLFAALTELGRIMRVRTVTKVLVTVMDEKFRNQCSQVASQLRADGISTALWCGDERSFKSQIAYATRQEIPVVLIIGANEAEGDMVAIKDMAARKQWTVMRAEVPHAVREILAR